MNPSKNEASKGVRGPRSADDEPQAETRTECLSNETLTIMVRELQSTMHLRHGIQSELNSMVTRELRAIIGRMRRLEIAMERDDSEDEESKDDQ